MWPGQSQQYRFHLLIPKKGSKKGFPCFEAILKTTDVILPSHTGGEAGPRHWAGTCPVLVGRPEWRQAGLERGLPVCWWEQALSLPWLLQPFSDYCPSQRGSRYTGTSLSFLLRERKMYVR